MCTCILVACRWLDVLQKSGWYAILVFIGPTWNGWLTGPGVYVFDLVEAAGSASRIHCNSYALSIASTIRIQLKLYTNLTWGNPQCRKIDDLDWPWT